MRPAHRVLLLLPVLLLAATSCDSPPPPPPPPPPPSQEPTPQQPKAASNADDAKADGPSGQDQRSGDDAPRAPEVSYSPETHERFQKLQQMINEAKKLKRTFHANENQQTWEAADEAMAKALNFGYEFPEGEGNYPGLQDTMAGLGQMISDHGQWTSDD